MADVFISYSRKDNQMGFVTHLYERLVADRISTWMDKTDIPPAVDFVKEISLSIDSANYFLFVLSPNSIDSDYCTIELERAVQNGKILVPVVREEVEPKLVPKALRQLNWIFLRATDSFEE